MTTIETRRIDIGLEKSAPRPAVALVHGVFEQQAQSTPCAVVVIDGEHHVTYATLNDLATRFARRLAAQGVAPERCVVLRLQRSLNLAVAQLAVLKCGAAYVPVDPHDPPSRLSYVLTDCRAAVIVVETEHDARRVHMSGVATLVMDGTTADEPSASRAMLDVAPSRELAACVMYTSGSTGRPKGVVVPHGAIIRRVTQCSYVSLQAEDCVAWASNPAFDAATFEIWAPLLAGGSAVVISRAVLLDPDAYARTVMAHRVAIAFLTTALFNHFVDAIPAALATIGSVLTGGERAAPDSFRRLLALPHGTLVHCYGPTETTIFATTLDVTPDLVSEVVPIGVPIDGTTASVLSADGHPVAIGDAGELHIGGDGLTRGYLNQPALTADRFVPNALGAPGSRQYRSGDLVRLRADRLLEFVGRVDGQIKLRGYRIEPGEIEAVVSSKPGILQAAVMVREDRMAVRALVAYYVVQTTETNATPALTELRAWVEERLPGYMVPAAFVRLESFPLNANGKVDYAALPAPTATTDGAGEFVAPETETEALLSRIYAEVLGLEEVSVTDRFLDLGGNSLAGVRIVSRVRAARGADLVLQSVFDDQTIRALARRIDRLATDDRDESAGESNAPPSIVPASVGQEAVWFFESAVPGNRAYQFQATLRFVGPLDVAALSRALSALVARHEVFRTTFHVEGGRLVQKVHAPWHVTLVPVELEGAPADHLAARLTEEFLTPFAAVDRLPLIRWTLFRTGDHEHVLAQVEHHFVHDGWSFARCVSDLRALYVAFARGAEPALAPPAMQFGQFALEERRWLESAAASRILEFWKQRLAGVPPRLGLRGDLPRPDVLGLSGNSVRIPLPPDLLAAVEVFSRTHGVTVFATMLAAFEILMARYADQEDFCMATAVANRYSAAVEDAVGMVVNAVPIRSDVAWTRSGAEVVARVRQSLLEAFAAERVPFSHVVRTLGLERSLTALPLCQVSFSFHDSPMPSPAWGDLRVEVHEGWSNRTAKYDLAVVGIPRASADESGGVKKDLTLIWEYSTEVFEAPTIEWMVRHYQELLRGLMASPATAVARLPMMPADETHLMLADFRETAGLSAPSAFLHERIAAFAVSMPDAPAIIAPDGNVSYRELDARSTRLAHYLRRVHGAGLEVRVAVCIERSAALAVAILAVLKTGAAYVPLDPRQPAARLRAIVADSRPRVGLHVGSGPGVSDVVADAAGPAWIDLEAHASAWGHEATAALESAATGLTPASSAYVIYTSGSTGQPKGVVVTHDGLTASTFARPAYYGTGGGAGGVERFLMPTSPAFDSSVAGLFWTLGTGGTLILPSDEMARNPAELVSLARHHRITHLLAVPVLYAAMLDAAGDEGLASLRIAIVAGEACPATVVRRHAAIQPHTELHNEYGPTEATVWCTAGCLWSANPESTVPPLITIGKPIPDRTAYILDDDGALAPIGVSGQLHVGGAGVMRGYLDRPSLTASRVRPDPFGVAGARLYETGDRARWRWDGTIEFLGRTDDQIKVRGVRIELGEIEAALASHPAVGAVLVVLRERVPGDGRLIAYCVLKDDASAQTVDAMDAAPSLSQLLRAHVAERLPEAMTPAVYVRIESFPLNSSGKINRNALPNPDESVGRAAFEAPVGDVESAIASMWSALLGAGAIGRRDDFFALGGHSLHAVELASRMRDAFRVDVAVPDVFEVPTVAGLSLRVLERQAHQVGADIWNLLAQIEQSS